MAKKTKKNVRACNDKRSYLFEDVNGNKRTVIREKPRGYLHEKPVWRFNKYDKEIWPVKTIDFTDRIFDKLADYEGMTWQEIQSASGGKNHGTNSHFEDVTELCKDARNRLVELKMDDIDRLFSLRLTGVERLYGVLEDGVFSILWYDKNHEIYPTKRS